MHPVCHSRTYAGCAVITLHPVLSSSLALAVDDGGGSGTSGGVLDCMFPKQPNKHISNSGYAVEAGLKCSTADRCAEMHLALAISRL
jgi:hypothetical protein